MNSRSSLVTGAAFAGLSVMIGAFGAHMLKDLLVQTGRAETFELAVRYQFYHAFALMITGICQRIDLSLNLKWASICFTVGIIIFSGSLYILSLTGIKQLGAVTPIGGLLFISGWLIFVIQILKVKSEKFQAK
jgi:uncharacterized membrane protein YgdD (TMEM256/DUF423 family)